MDYRQHYWRPIDEAQRGKTACCITHCAQDATQVLTWITLGMPAPAFYGYCDHHATIHKADPHVTIQGLTPAAFELVAAARDLIAQLQDIGIPDWHGAEGLDLERTLEALKPFDHVEV